MTYLDLGLDVEGIEVSREMIALCREAAVERGLEPTLHQVAKQDMDLERRYRTILVPTSSFQLLTEREAARSAMGRFFEHLQAAGRLAMSFMVVWRAGQPTEQSWRVVAEAQGPEPGTRIRRWGMVTHDVAACLQSTRDRYEVLAGEEVLLTENHERSPAARWYSLEEALELYSAAGFEDVRAARDFSREPAAPEDDLFVVVETRPVRTPQGCKRRVPGVRMDAWARRRETAKPSAEPRHRSSKSTIRSAASPMPESTNSSTLERASVTPLSALCLRKAIRARIFSDSRGGVRKSGCMTAEGGDASQAPSALRPSSRP